MNDASAVLEGFPDAVLVLHGDRVEWANRRAHALIRCQSLIGASLRGLIGDDEDRRLGLLRRQRGAGWALPETCRVRFLSAEGADVLLDMRIAELPDGRSVLSGRDATEATRAEKLMGRLAELSSGVLMRDETALFDATEQIFLDLKWVVAFTRVLPEGSQVERVIAQANDPVGDYGRSLLGQVLPRAATAVLQKVVTERRPLFLDNIPALTEPHLSAAALSASMEAGQVARNAWCPIFTPGLTHVLAVTGADLTEHDFAAIQLFGAQVGATIRLTELRRELVRRERLAAIGETATVLAHELRAPLAVVFNVVGALSQWARGLELPATDRQQLATLIALLDEEAERLQRLVTDLLDFGGMTAPRVESVEVIDVVSNALDAARHEKSWQAHSPTVEFDATVTNTRAMVDPAQLRRAILNLLENAAQHVRSKGVLRITVTGREATVEVRVWNEGDRLQASVAQRLFEPFFTTRHGGTGLGLAIARRICTELGGKVELEPVESGVGFLVTLPRGAPEHA